MRAGGVTETADRGSRRLAGAFLIPGLASLVLLAIAASPPRAAALEGAAVIALVNAQRAANGIPPITTVDQSYASWCPNEYAPDQPGESGRVSASYDNWSRYATPYSTAPLHQEIIYSPFGTVAGDVFAHGHDCMGVGGPGLQAWLQPAPTPTFYAFVNERGPQDAVTSELADELPTTPQQEVGLPLDTRTGPQIILWAQGLGFAPRPSSVTLTALPGTPVPHVRVASGGFAFILVPPVLEAGTSYRLQVQWTTTPPPPELTQGVAVAPRQAVQTLTFATQPSPRRPTSHRRRRRRH